MKQGKKLRVCSPSGRAGASRHHWNCTSAQRPRAGGFRGGPVAADRPSRPGSEQHAGACARTYSRTAQNLHSVQHEGMHRIQQQASLVTRSGQGGAGHEGRAQDAATIGVRPGRGRCRGQQLTARPLCRGCRALKGLRVLHASAAGPTVSGGVLPPGRPSRLWSSCIRLHHATPRIVLSQHWHGHGAGYAGRLQGTTHRGLFA